MNENKFSALFVTTIDLNFECGGTRYSKSVLSALPPACKVQTLILSKYHKTKDRNNRWIYAFVKSLLTGVPPNVLFHSDDLTDEAHEILKMDWDVILLDHLESCYILRKLTGKPCIYVSQNRESQLIGNKLPNAPEWLKRMLTNWVDRFEVRISKSVQGILSISNVEAEWYRQFSKNVGIIYPVFNVPRIIPNLLKSSDELRIGFLGSAKWWPNAEAVQILINEILPQTSRKILLVLAGGDWLAEEIEAEIRRKATNENVKVIVHGYVPDIQTFWNSIDVLAAPIVSGAGVNVKVCEALANGLSVVALPHTMRGLSENVMSCGGVFMAYSTAEFSKILDSFEIVDFMMQPPCEFTPNFAEQRLLDVLELAVKA